jgi:prophage antirepressor-like protein
MNDQNPLDFVAQNSLVSEESFEGHTLRTVYHENEYWFVANDVAAALGYNEPSKAIKRFCKGVAQHCPIQTKGGVQEMRIINKPDLYRLVLKSEAKGAERFQDWIVEDLLPTLEREGSYHMALKDVPKEPWTLEEIEVLVDRHLPPIAPPAPPKGDDALFNLLPTRPTAHQKREDARADARARLQAIRAGYGVLRARYPHFESAVKQATLLGSQKYIEQAEQLQEESREFGNWAWTECLRLNLGPEDIPSVRNPSDVFWRIDFAELFKAQFKADWQKYVIEEGASRKAFEPAEDIRYLFKFK